MSLFKVPSSRMTQTIQMLANSESHYREKKRVDIEPLLRYLEIKRKGSWRDFDALVKELIPDIDSNVFSLADRLSAQGFLEFAWQDRSWEFSPTTLVQSPLIEVSAPGETSKTAYSRWNVFGATRETIDYCCSVNGITSARTIVEIELPRHRLRFVRCAVIADDPSHLFQACIEPGICTRWMLEAMFGCLPSIKLAAQNWIGEEPEVEAATLRGAMQSEKSDQKGQWHRRPFDGSPGFWRVDGIIRRYFWVSAEADPKDAHIVRTPPDLGRWFDASAPGLMKYDSTSNAMLLELSSKVIDLPVLFERWLMLWGSTRRLKSIYPTTVGFDRVDLFRARKLARLLSLKEVVNASVGAAPGHPNRFS